MRLISLSKSKSEVFGQSGHCSARLLAALRAITGREQAQQDAPGMPRPTYSITSSARARTLSGTSTPSAFAVFRLMAISNLVGCTTGRSAALSPFRIRPA